MLPRHCRLRVVNCNNLLLQLLNPLLEPPKLSLMIEWTAKVYVGLLELLRTG